MTLMRLFFALWPDDKTRALLSELQQGLNGRKTRRENLHMTLAFLGEQPESVLPRLQEVIDETAVPEMSLTIDRIGYFKRQRIAWAGMHDVPQSLLAMQQVLSSTLEKKGIPFDRRDAFQPHLTLARDAAPAKDFRFAPILWRACQFSLVHSVAEPAGLTYRVLASRYCGAIRTRPENP